LVLYQADLIAALVYHSLTLLGTAFLPDKYKKNLILSGSGKFLGYLALLSAFMSLINIVSHGILLQYAHQFSLVLDELIKQNHQIGEHLD
jgi:hypothetical protein